MRFSNIGGGPVQLVDVGRLQRVLIQAAADLPADADQRRILQVGADAGDRVELRPQLAR